MVPWDIQPDFFFELLKLISSWEWESRRPNMFSHVLDIQNERQLQKMHISETQFLIENPF